MSIVTVIISGRSLRYVYCLFLAILLAISSGMSVAQTQPPRLRHPELTQSRLLRLRRQRRRQARAPPKYLPRRRTY